MPAVRKVRPPVEDRIREELQLISRTVAGVSGSLVASSDGLVVAYDVPGLEPTQIAALAAATLSLASRATLATGLGDFREAVARGSNGYLAVYAAGASALVAVIGTSDMNLGMLHYQARDIIDRIAKYSAELGNRTTQAPSPAPAPARRTAAGSASPVAPTGTAARAEGRPILPRRRTSSS
jgi:predicted regulator of Ras-like GTPase activity (Roadblock/LC7/MglB family)